MDLQKTLANLPESPGVYIYKNAKGDVQTDAEIADHNQFQIAYYEYRKKLKQINNEESFNQ